MSPATETRCTAEYVMRDGGWIVTAKRGNDSVVAYGRTLEKARQNIAAELAHQLKIYAGRIAIDDDIDVSSTAIKAMDKARQAKEAALRAAAESTIATREAAKRLEAEGLSLRDIAYVLGLSHSRVHQVLGQPAKPKNQTEGKAKR